MISINPEERPKVIGLVTAICVVLGVGGVSVAKQTRIGSAPPAPTAAAGASGAAPTTAGPVGSAPAAASAAAAAIPPVIAKPKAAAAPIAQANLGLDPFRPIEALKTTDARPASPPPPSRQPLLEDSGSITQVPPLPAPGAASAMRQPGPIPALLPAAFPDAPLSLIGVITGPRAVAMIRCGTDDQFVHRNDIIRGFRIERIDSDTVTLRRGKEERVLRVGVEPLEPVLPAPPAAQQPVTGPAPAAKPPVRGFDTAWDMSTLTAPVRPSREV